MRGWERRRCEFLLNAWNDVRGLVLDARARRLAEIFRGPVLASA